LLGRCEWFVAVYLNHIQTHIVTNSLHLIGRFIDEDSDANQPVRSGMFRKLACCRLAGINIAHALGKEIQPDGSFDFMLLSRFSNSIDVDLAFDTADFDFKHSVPTDNNFNQSTESTKSARFDFGSSDRVSDW
jgi:hypothetical protein